MLVSRLSSVARASGVLSASIVAFAPVSRSRTWKSYVRSNYSGSRQHGSSSSSLPASNFISWLGAAAGASVAALVLASTSGTAENEEVSAVHEFQTGTSFPITIRVPPVFCDIGEYRGSRPGLVFQNGPKGLGYYQDKHLGGTRYIKESSGNAIEQRLVGVGMRCMLQKCEYHIARAYAIGMYADEATMSSEDSQTLHHPKLTKTLLLVMAREVKGGHIGKGFDRTLIPKLRTMTGEKNGTWKEDLRQFTSTFNKCGVLHPGDEVLFFMPGDETLTIYIKGREAEKIHSQVFCDAVMDMYVGEKTVAPNVRTNFIEGFQKAYSLGIRAMGPPPGTSTDKPQLAH